MNAARTRRGIIVSGYKRRRGGIEGRGGFLLKSGQSDQIPRVEHEKLEQISRTCGFLLNHLSSVLC